MPHSLELLCKIRPKKTLNKRIQERALPIVFREKSATCEELLKKAGLTTLYNRRLQDIAITIRIMMYQVKHKLLPIYVVNIFKENETRHHLRDEMDFKIPRFPSVRYETHS